MERAPKILCVGGATIDVKVRTLEPVVLRSSNPVRSVTTWGGVARNISENLARLEFPVSLISRVGNDTEGDSIVNRLNLFQIDSSGVSRSARFPTAKYTALLEADGEMIVAMADMDIYEELTPEIIGQYLDKIEREQFVIVDSNLPQETLQFLVKKLPASAQLWATPVSIPKMPRLRPILSRINGMILNSSELSALMQRSAKNYIEIKALCVDLVEHGVATVIVTCGGGGVFLAHQGEYFFFKINSSSQNIDVTGAGDAFSAGVLFGLHKSYTLPECVRLGLASAKLTLQTDATVSPMLNSSNLLKEAGTTSFEMQEVR